MDTIQEPHEVSDGLFTREYRRCSFPAINKFMPGKTIAAVPGGIIYVSKGKPYREALLFCDYRSPQAAFDLFKAKKKIQCKAIMSVTFTGVLVVIVATSNLNDVDDQGLEEEGVWAFFWPDLRDGNVIPLKLPGVPSHFWGTVAGGNQNVAIVNGGTLMYTSPSEPCGEKKLRQTEVSLDGADNVILSIGEPQIVAIIGRQQMALAPLDSPDKLGTAFATLLMEPSCAAISDNGQMLAIGYSTGLLEVWDTHDLEKPVFRMNELDTECRCLCFSSLVGDRLFAAGEKSELLVLDTRDFSTYQKMWLPAIPRPSDTLSRYDLRSALWPDDTDVYELPVEKPENFISSLFVHDMVWLGEDDGVLAIGTSEGVLFVRCGYRSEAKSVEWM